MKTKFSFRQPEKGQVIPIVVIGILVIIMMAALMIDGGMLLSHRRIAQAAADAGALAGARSLCPNNEIDVVQRKLDARAVAINYVEDKNNAVFTILPDKEQFPDDYTIHVETSVSSQAFFARIFGELGLTANAVAEAKCTAVSGASVLPIGFPCYPEDYFEEMIDEETGEPIEYSGPASENNICFVRYGDRNQTIDWHIINKRMVIVMDTKDITDGTIENPFCYPDGVINCEITDGETKSVLLSDSNRGWLSLDGKGGAASICEFIYPGKEDFIISRGTWISGNTGVINSMWTRPDCLKMIVGEEVLVPIFNEWCRGKDPENDCPEKWRTGDTLQLSNGEDLMYRIEAFAIFKLTCIEGPNTPKKDACPYRKYLIEDSGLIILDKPNELDNVSSIEGYFLEGTVTDASGFGIDIGSYVISLTK